MREAMQAGAHYVGGLDPTSVDGAMEKSLDTMFQIPQHGLLLSKSESLMREAMQAGAHYVGGLDPTSVDGAMEKSLDTMFQIALDYDKGVDIHLHETTPAGVAAINYMVETVEKTKRHS